MTGAGIVDCKNALTEAGDDIQKAIEVLKKKGALKAAKKSSERTTSEGVVATYVHHTKKLAAMVEVQCETDFVARTDEFQAFANDLAMQVAAINPDYVSLETVPAEILAKLRAEFMEEVAKENKPEEIKAKIVEGKILKWATDACLLNQAFFKNEDVTINDLLTQKIATIGEKIIIARFTRYQLG